MITRVKKEFREQLEKKLAIIASWIATLGKNMLPFVEGGYLAS